MQLQIAGWGEGCAGLQAAPRCYWGMQLQIAGSLIMVGEGCAGLQVAPRCYWGMQLQIARRLIMVG